MELTIVTPRGIQLALQVDRASFPGTQGAFTVMPNHAPIISTLRRGKVRYKEAGDMKEGEVDVEDGLVEIKQNQIWIYTEQ